MLLMNFCRLFSYNEKYVHNAFVFDDFFITVRKNSIHHTLCMINGENVEKILIVPNITNLSIG